MSNIFTHSQLDIRSNPNLFINGDGSLNQRGNSSNMAQGQPSLHFEQGM